MENEPDYGSYTTNELYDAQCHLDRDRYPARARRLAEEIARRHAGTPREPAMRASGSEPSGIGCSLRRFFWPPIENEARARALVQTRFGVAACVAGLAAIRCISSLLSLTSGASWEGVATYVILAAAFRRKSLPLVSLVVAWLIFGQAFSVVQQFGPMRLAMLAWSAWFFGNGVRAVVAYQRFRHPGRGRLEARIKKCLGFLRYGLILSALQTCMRQEGLETGRWWLYTSDPADAPGRRSWGFRHLFLGLFVLMSQFAATWWFNHSAFLAHRPWLVEPLATLFYLGTDGLVIAWVTYTCRSHGSWPLILPVNLHGLWTETLKAAKYLLVVLLALAPLAVVLEGGLGVEIRSSRFHYLESAPGTTYALFVLLTMITIAPLAEEFLFRGLLYTVLRSRLRIAPAAVCQAAIFSACHLENLFNSLAIFALGVASALLYERRKNLLSPILLHVMKNCMPVMPLLLLTLLNFHIPAKNWDEARTPPGWLYRYAAVERQQDGLRQWQQGQAVAERRMRRANQGMVVLQAQRLSPGERIVPDDHGKIRGV